LNLSNNYEFFKYGNYYNVALGGDTISNMINEYHSQVEFKKPLMRNDVSYLFLWAGINDIRADRTSSQIYNNLKTEWEQARADGFKVIAFTITNASGYYNLTASQDTNRNNLNNLILSDTSLYDYIIRPELLFPDSTDTTYYFDGIHLNYYADNLLAENISGSFPLSTPSQVGLNTTIIIGDTPISFDKIYVGDDAITFWNISNLETSTETLSFNITQNNTIFSGQVIRYSYSDNFKKVITSDLTNKVNATISFNVADCSNIGNIKETNSEGLSKIYRKEFLSSPYTCNSNIVTINNVELASSSQFDISYDCSSFTILGYNLILILSAFGIIIFSLLYPLWKYNLGDLNVVDIIISFVGITFSIVFFTLISDIIAGSCQV
jgi:hypothetical protein